MDEVLRRFSPLHLASEMPDVTYFVFHCTDDKSVNIDAHSEKFVAAMTPAHNVTFIKVPGCGHCSFPPHVTARWNELIEAEIAR